MSRTRRAAIAASFGYVQYALALGSGLVLVPLTLKALGARGYGLWLATGELLGYAALIDLGVLAVMPWMLAEADGRRDRDAMRTLIANGVVVGAIVGGAFAGVAAALWQFLPAALGFSAADRSLIGPALAIVVAATALSYPLRIFAAVVAGLQDATFYGWLGVTQTLTSAILTITLLAGGWGVRALAAAMAVSVLLVSGGCFLRVLLLAPDLLRGWPRPTTAGVRLLLANGIGAWLGGFGWQLLSASNGLVITMNGHPEWVPLWACTAKLSAVATQITWVLPDAGLVGLAQLQGEHDSAPPRLRTVVQMMLRLHLLLAGGAATCALAFNAAFVTRWVGPALFGGPLLNALLATGIVVYSLTHGLSAAAAVLGNRLRVGTVTLANGVIQLVAALLLGRAFALPGIAAAGLLAAVAVAVPVTIALLRPAAGLSFASVGREVIAPWLRRASPMLAAGSVAGALYPSIDLWATALLTAALGATYVWWMRPLYLELPIDPRLARWLVSLRLIPTTAPAIASVEQA